MASKWDVNKAVRDSGVMPAPSRLIMFVLSDLADATTGRIPAERVPSLAELAGMTGLGTATVKRHLTLLEGDGWVERDRPSIVAARTEHARTGYTVAVGHGSDGAMPIAQAEPSHKGHVGSGMAQSEPAEQGHGSERAKGMAHSEPVPYTDEVTNDKTTSTSANATKPKRRPSKQKPPPDRPDVERICEHLADRIEANGSLRPNIGAKWRDAARLLLDKDGRTVEQVLRAIDWCQAHDFWRANIKSMPKLREQYDTLRLHAQRPNGRASPRPSNLVEHNGLMLGERNQEALERHERIKRLQAAKDAGQPLGIEGHAA